MSWREYLAEMHEELLLLEPETFDAAILGVAQRADGTSAVAYDVDRCIESLMSDGMSLEEAWEYFDFNTAGAWVGPHTPIFIHTQKPE